jgi:hypothetical protein
VVTVAARLPQRGHEDFPGRCALSGLAVDDQHVLLVRPVRRKRLDHSGVIETRNSLGTTSPVDRARPTETEFPLPVDRDERVADRPDAGRRIGDDDPLDPVRELEGDDIARPYSEFEQAEGAPVDLSLQLGMTDLVARVDERDLVRSQGGDLVDAVRDGAVSQ